MMIALIGLDFHYSSGNNGFETLKYSVPTISFNGQAS